MFSQVSESTLHKIRWVLLVGWLLLIVSFFYDPFSSYLTEPDVSWSLFHLYPDYFDPLKCRDHCNDTRRMCCGSTLSVGT